MWPFPNFETKDIIILVYVNLDKHLIMLLYKKVPRNGIKINAIDIGAAIIDAWD